MDNEEIFDMNQAEFYGVSMDTIRKMLGRETPHMYVIKDGDKFRSEMLTESEYKEKYERKPVRSRYKYNVPDRVYGKGFSKNWTKEVF